ncbi:MAG TPA: hypothetical protein VLK33_23240 [Terriglobales bacterium]|nr:hypothetical protein [Terriglobales bacterium]
MNLPFRPPELTPLQSWAVHTAIKLVATFALGHGFAHFASVITAADTTELILGAVTLIIALVSSAKANTTQAIQQKAADTLPAGTVLPATTDASPNAQVLSPESATEFIRKQTGQTTPPAL